MEVFQEVKYTREGNVCWLLLYLSWAFNLNSKRLSFEIKNCVSCFSILSPIWIFQAGLSCELRRKGTAYFRFGEEGALKHKRGKGIPYIILLDGEGRG